MSCRLATVAHLNCSQPGCAINGLTISGAGFQSGPAVRVLRGRTLSTFIADPGAHPEGALGVVDGLGTPAGSFVGRYQISSVVQSHIASHGITYEPG
jgi:hypothetical protein